MRMRSYKGWKEGRRGGACSCGENRGERGARRLSGTAVVRACFAFILLQAAAVVTFGPIGCDKSSYEEKEYSTLSVRLDAEGADCGISPAVFVLEPQNCDLEPYIRVWFADEIGKEKEIHAPNGDYVASLIAPVNADGSTFEALKPKAIALNGDRKMGAELTSEISASEASKGLYVLVARALELARETDGEIPESSISKIRGLADDAPDPEGVGSRTAEEIVDDLHAGRI